MTAPPERESAASKIIQLAERAQDVIAITELEPCDNKFKFIGKQINRDGSITEYPRVTLWQQRVTLVPATISHLFAFLCEARERNICLIRGAPANLARQPTRRWKAGLFNRSDRGDHGFLDEPTKLLFFDVDGAPTEWKADPEGGVKNVVAQLGEPWASTSFVWFFSATHGLERDEHKRWTGKISDGVVRVRLAFITDRATTAGEAGALNKIAQARVPFKLDAATTRVVQPNYIRRPHWVGHPDRDVLGDISTIGYVRGEKEIAAVPDDLAHTAHLAKAQGHHVDIAQHPNAEAAVRGIGSGGEVRQHLKSAVIHLLITNLAPDVVGFADHSIVIADKLQRMVKQHREEIEVNLAQHNRHWSDVLHYLPDNMADFAFWCLNHQGILRGKTIKLIKEERVEPNDATSREAIFAGVERAVVRACVKALVNENPSERPPAILLVAPTGSRKSTLLRAAAVLYVTEHPNKTVVILVPRHKLGDEQIDRLRKENPNDNFTAAVWRGRHADDPESPDLQHPGKFMKMCQRDADVAMVEEAMVDVDHLCKQGRGEKAIKCPLYDPCRYQGQKQTKANIWFAAHECAVHEMQKVFGDVGWVIFDENPLDAFMFGVNINDQVELALDMLHTPLPGGRAKFKGGFDRLMDGRAILYHALDKLRVPIDFHQSIAVLRESLKEFTATSERHHAKHMRNFTFRGKVEPKIRPDMTKEQLKIKLQEAAGNDIIKKEVTLWGLIEVLGDNNTVKDAINNAIERDLTIQELVRLVETTRRYGRIQIYRGKQGRMIRMVGLEQLAKGWNVPTLICDATGDVELLKAIWPQLTEAEPHGWRQLPRPKSVRVFQCVDRSIPKWAVAVEGKDSKTKSEKRELERRIDGARRLYAAVLKKALEYGGQNVGVIVYKSTKEWIQENCYVPKWLKLVHWGEHTGTNALEKVRALFMIGRWQASAEAVTRMTEALFGGYIPQREYVKRQKQGRIPIVPDAGGNNCILVDVWEHLDPVGERLRRQITEGNIIQAVGRARAGLRGEDEPLDIHLWTDVPVPELGPVEPVLGGELEAGLDGLMLAVGGVWLESIPDAVKAYEGLFTTDGLKSSRKSRMGISQFGTPISYQKAGERQRPQRALALVSVDAARAWLEEKLGPLVYCEAVGHERTTA